MTDMTDTKCQPDTSEAPEDWAEVTDGTTLPGDRFSYILNPEIGIGQITSHKRRVASPLPLEQEKSHG